MCILSELDFFCPKVYRKELVYVVIRSTVIFQYRPLWAGLRLHSQAKYVKRNTIPKNHHSNEKPYSSVSKIMHTQTMHLRSVAQKTPVLVKLFQKM